MLYVFSPLTIGNAEITVGIVVLMLFVFIAFFGGEKKVEDLVNANYSLAALNLISVGTLDQLFPRAVIVFIF